MIVAAGEGAVETMAAATAAGAAMTAAGTEAVAETTTAGAVAKVAMTGGEAVAEIPRVATMIEAVTGRTTPVMGAAGEPTITG